MSTEFNKQRFEAQLNQSLLTVRKILSNERDLQMPEKVHKMFDQV
jgi:hypothetical protein